MHNNHCFSFSSIFTVEWPQLKICEFEFLKAKSDKLTLGNVYDLKKSGHQYVSFNNYLVGKMRRIMLF